MAVQSSPSKSIDIVGASAGTGKTTRLAAEFVNAVQGSTNRKPISPGSIVVCTFTRKAAEEISSRIRQSLIHNGHPDAAQLVLSGYVGTVNSICGRLLKDYALECGLSPQQDVIPEQMQSNLFAIATASVLDAFAQDIESVAERLSFTETSRKSRFQRRTHWMDHVRTITDLARANGMNSDTLRQSAERSWKGMKTHLAEPKMVFDPAELDDLLTVEMERVINGIDLSRDSTEMTATAMSELRDCFARSRNDCMTWRDWAALKKLEVGKDSREFIKNLTTACAALPHHPQLHKDLKKYILSIFECAAEALDAYQAYKSSNGLVDFVDQEYLTLRLLDDPRVRASLKSRLELVLIDEFQDTSPIQLALFIKLANIVEQSVWVGDIKQAIYGFRGTDPQLMQEASLMFNRQAPLEQSFRSRPELVKLSNEIFKRVFSEHGMAEEDVIIHPSGKRAPAEGHAIEVWRCKGNDLDECFSALATATRELLLGSDAPQVEDPHTGELRRIRGSDVAILCRKNDHCSRIAIELAQQNLQVAMTRDGLLDTPECLLTIAALRFLVDASDKYALATIVHLKQNYTEVDQSKWLNEWLSVADKKDSLLENRESFMKARAELPRHTISDALNLAMSLSGVLEMVCGWGNVPSRMSNLDALRGLALEFEATCAMARTSVTINGFLNYLDQLEESNQPASVNVDAVQILTYHGAKGLEWPVVVLADLDSGFAPRVHKDLCRPVVESVEKSLDLSDPLRGRWIRFWPWPFGGIEKDGHFDVSAAGSLEYKATDARVRAENARLMYVGMTRARDVLVLSPYLRRKNDPGTQWLDELTYKGLPIIQLPETTNDTFVVVGDSTHSARHSTFEPSVVERTRLRSEAVFMPEPAIASFDRERIAYFLQPSSLIKPVEEEIPDDAVTIYDIGERIALADNGDMAALGDCVHGFLAADDLTAARSARFLIADRVRRNWNIEEISSADLLTMSNRFVEFLQSQFKEFRRYDECPVVARMKLQRLRGTIDVLIETGDGFHILDHKTFPGPVEKWIPKALSFYGQLQAYRFAMKQATSRPVHRLFIHMPVIGKVIELHELI
jgi:ATP-dependent helicase/nuclease subunit A